MAKGDSGRAQDMLKRQSATAQSGMNDLNDNLYESNANFRDNYNMGTGMNMGSYDEIMSGYRNMMPGGSNSSGGGSGGPIGNNSYGGYQDLAKGNKFGWDSLFRGAMKNAIGGYNDFAQTGGFTDQGLQDIRARGVAPMRATYANAQNNLDRSRSLSGGSPNYAAAQTKMARELGYGLSDQMTDINAGIAQMVQQGKLAGLGGLSQTGAAGQGLSTNIDALNLQAMLAGLGGMTGIDQARAAANRAGSAQSSASQLAALRGMTDLYGTTPALAKTFGDQVLNSEGNLINSQQLQNQLSLGLIGGQNQKGQLPGTTSQVLNGIKDLLPLISGAAGALGTRGGGSGAGTTIVPGTGTGSTSPSDRKY